MTSNNFLNKLLKFSIPSIISAFIALCVLPIISRVYPEAEYGYISNFYSIGNLALGVFLLGLDSAYIRFFYEHMEGANRSGLLVFSIKIGGILCTVVFVFFFIFFKEKIALYLFNDTSYWGLFLLYLYVLLLIMYRMLNINNRFSEKITAYNIQQVCFIIGNKLVFLLAAFFSTRYIFSVLIMVVSTGIIVLISFIRQRDDFKNPLITKKTVKTMFRFALPLMPTTIVIFLNDSIAKLVLGGYGQRNSVGVFAIATSVANVFSIIPTAFAVYWGAFMYKNYKTERKLICQVHDIIMLLSLVLVLGILSFQDFIYILLGSNYRTSQVYFMLVMLSPVFNLLSETTSYGIALSGKTKYTLYTALMGCIVNFIACLLLIPMIGAQGAAIGIAISGGVVFICRTILAQKEYRSIGNYLKSFCSCVIIVLICCLNLFMYNKIAIRIVITISILGVIFIYYQDLMHLLKRNYLLQLFGKKE